MKSLSDKTKRLLVSGCLAIVCVVLVVAIYSRFQTRPAKDDGIQKANTVSQEITPTPGTPQPDVTPEKKDEVVANPIEPTPTPAGTPTKDTNESVQSNVPKAVKPTPPPKPKAQGDATNPSKPPEYKSEDTTKSKPSEPKGGEKKDGQTYVPGFGWVKDEGGGVQQNIVGSDGDINKQVGSMD